MLDITARGERAEFNGCYLARLISQFPAQARVSFFGHSFGARVVASTLHLMAGGTIPGCQFRCPEGPKRTYRAVFAAAAIDRHWLNPGQRYDRALWVTEWLLNINNQADFVINLYPLRSIISGHALGRFGFSRRDRQRMGLLSARVTEWDATRLIAARHAWVFYYSRPEIATVMGPLVGYFQNQPVATTAPKQRVSYPSFSDHHLTTSPPRVFRDSTHTPLSTSIRSGL